MKNFFVKHKLLTGIIVLILIGGLASGGSKDSTEKSDDKASETAVETKKDETKDIYDMNEAAKLKNAVVTVTNVERSAGGKYDKPKDNMEFVIVSVTIKNEGKDTISYNPFDFKMKNSKGQITDQAFTTVNNDTNLHSGELAEGGEISGTIAFEQPKGDTGLVLQYKGNMFSSKEIKFKLN